jgi:prefoldin subunit 5
MDDKIKARLEQLQMELRAGKEQLDEVEARRAALRETLLRISGAIMVLEELTGDESLPQPEPEVTAEAAGNGVVPSPA